MNADSRELFQQYMHDCGIDPSNPQSQTDKLVLPVAFGAWQAQQLRIDDMQQRIDRFKASFVNL